MPWFKDRVLLLLLGVGLVLRTLPMAVWAWVWPCLRDECTYFKLAQRIVDGEGMTASSGWLWAPGYPYLMAAHQLLFGQATTVRGTQVVLALGITLGLYLAGRALLGGDGRGGEGREADAARRAGRIAAGLYALSPPQAFFAMGAWSEVVYTALLLAAVALTLAARRRDGGRALGLALLGGLFVGACVLFRGVATYMLPLFPLALLWGRWRRPAAWGQALALPLVTVLTVAPYSLHASRKFETFVLSDRTLGQMMWLGNNTFEPVSFDYGNGHLSTRAFERHTDPGRPYCAPRKEAMRRDACEVQEGLAWIRAHPGEFLARIPLRAAQLLTPHSLLTRHLRWGYWPGLPLWVDELIIVLSAALGLGLLWLGPLGLLARARGAFGLLSAGLLLYHLLAISMLAGLSRYRVPLEPFLMLGVALLLAEPGPGLAALRQRWPSALLLLAALVPLGLWFLPAGFPGWRRW